MAKDSVSMVVSKNELDALRFGFAGLIATGRDKDSLALVLETLIIEIEDGMAET